MKSNVFQPVELVLNKQSMGEHLPLLGRCRFSASGGCGTGHIPISSGVGFIRTGALWQGTSAR